MKDMLSNTMSVLCAVIFITTIITITVEKAIPQIRNKVTDKNVDKGIETASAVIDATENVVSTIATIFPNSKAVNVLQIIEKWSRKSVEAVEQLYNASKLDKAKKKDTAKQQVYSVLKLLGIEKTDEIETIIDGAIEAEVYMLSK